MTGAKKLSDELQILRTLCDEAVPREQRIQLTNSVRSDLFVTPEHAIVFEAVRALLPLGPLDAAHLRIHLTRRGFPDTDVEQYF